MAPVRRSSLATRFSVTLQAAAPSPRPGPHLDPTPRGWAGQRVPRRACKNHLRDLGWRLANSEPAEHTVRGPAADAPPTQVGPCSSLGAANRRFPATLSRQTLSMPLGVPAGLRMAQACKLSKGGRGRCAPGPSRRRSPRLRHAPGRTPYFANRGGLDERPRATCLRAAARKRDGSAHARDDCRGDTKQSGAVGGFGCSSARAVNWANLRARTRKASGPPGRPESACEPRPVRRERRWADPPGAPRLVAAIARQLQADELRSLSNRLAHQGSCDQTPREPRSLPGRPAISR